MALGKRKAPSSPGSRQLVPAAPGPPRFFPCPMCGKSFDARKFRGLSELEKHVEKCIGAPPSSPVGAGKGGTPASRNQSPGRMTDTKKASWPGFSHGSKVDSPSTAAAPGSSAATTSPKMTAATCTGGQQGDAIQRLMKASKRAAEAEKELRIIPPVWPVECIEDLLPAEKADSLLARLLHASRAWTARPWSTATGNPGWTHHRSCMYRIPTAARESSSSRSSSSISGTDRDQTRPAQASGEARLCPGARPTAGSDGVAESGGGGGVESDGGAVGKKGEGGTVHDVLRRPPQEEGFDSGSPEAGKAGGADRPGSATAAGRSEEGVVQGPTPDSEAGDSGKAWTKDDRRATGGEQYQDHDSAPEELLEVVPLVVEAVRRRQRRRVEEGLGGHEGLSWNPNFCLCNIYDDHRNHIGLHSDTLSSIGPNGIVVGVSLGAKRDFEVQEKKPWRVKPPAGSGSEGEKKLLDMPHNSAIVMWGGCQERYKHAVPSMKKGVGLHPLAGTKRISITLRERKETLPQFLLPVPDCRCGVPATLNSRVLANGGVNYYFHCDRARGNCDFTLFKGLPG